jgi:hypothetical protein
VNIHLTTQAPYADTLIAAFGEGGDGGE